MLWICLAVLGALVPSSLANEGVNINLDVSKSAAHPGDNVTFICRITNMPEDGYMYWAKSIIGIHEVEVMDLIGGGSNKLVPYDTFRNYKLEHSQTNQEKYYTLTITNVTVQETGHYICSYREVEENAYQMESFVVYDQVDSVRMFLNTTNEEILEQGIEADADVPVTLEIDVGESVPPADVRVFVGDEEVTDSFVDRHQTIVKCEGTFVKTCPLHYVQKTTLVSSAFEFQPEYRGLEFLVSTEVPGAGFEHYNVTFPVLVNYAPIYKCFTLHAAKVGDYFELQCKVRAYPMAEDFFWIIPQGDMNVTINPREEYVTTGMYDAKAKHVEGNDWLVTLIIPQVSEENYKHYYLQAGNHLGNTTLTMELVEDIPATADPNSGSLMSLNVAMFLGAILAGLMRAF